MARKLKPDRVLFVITLTLVAIGVAMVFSSSAVMAKARFGDAHYFTFKQLLAVILGLAVMFVVMKVDYHVFSKPVVVFSILAGVIALLVLVFFLAPMANTHRWIPFPGFSVQPSEIAKLALIVFLAYFLEKRKSRVNDVTFTLLPIAVVSGLMMALIVPQPDLGTAVSLLLVATVLLIVAGLHFRWFALALMCSIPLLGLLIFGSPYKRSRIFSFLDPWADPQGSGFQIIQSLIAVATGGITGLGYMESKQKLFYLPEAHTDFIFSILAEEFGMIGALAVLALFGVFLWRGMRASLRAPDLFGFYLALGITMMISLQALINMSVVLQLMPTKGIPLPFLSYGGSSIVVMLASVGILLNVSQQSS